MKALQVPSGKIFSPMDLNIMRDMNLYGVVRRSDDPFTLKSGIQSHVYVFGREDLTDNTNMEVLIGRKIAEEIRYSQWQWIFEDQSPPRQVCLIGVPTAGTVLAQAAAMEGFRMQTSYGEHPCHRLMREVKKGHGAHHTWVNGKPDPGKHVYALIDNVATNGQSKLEAREKLLEDGYPVDQVPALIFIDRQQGAVPRLKKAGFPDVAVCYNLLDITYAFGELGLWPKETVRQVEEEIAAHQFLTE